MLKVLIIGQLPAEVGGNFTTGIAKVVYELSRQKIDGVAVSVYATNSKHNRISISDGPARYYGYRLLVGKMLLNMLSHPFQTLKEWKVYQEKGKVNPLRFEFYKANFQWILNEVKPDLIHMNGAGIEPLYFANKYRVPVVLTCHGVFQRYRNPESSARLFADYVTGLTDETLAEIQDYFCVEHSKITIIPNGVDTNKFYYSEEERRKIRMDMGVNNHTTVFVTVASVQERKGQLRFVQLLKELKDEDWQYWVIGKGPDEESIRNYSEANGISKHVKLIGYKSGDELYKYYSAADVYAHASTMEGQALCEIEAFSTGIKILVNQKIKGTIAKNELNEGDYLIMDFEHPDLEALRCWMRERTGQRKSNKTMDWSVVARQYGELYKRILETNK